MLTHTVTHTAESAEQPSHSLLLSATEYTVHILIYKFTKSFKYYTDLMHGWSDDINTVNG